MRSTQRPPRLFTDSHERTAVKMLPRCIRPVGEGAKRPRNSVEGGTTGSRKSVGEGAKRPRSSVAVDDDGEWSDIARRMADQAWRVARLVM